LFVIFSINVINSIAAVGRNFTGDLLFAIVSLYVVSFSLFTSMSMVITDITVYRVGQDKLHMHGPTNLAETHLADEDRKLHVAGC